MSLSQCMWHAQEISSPQQMFHLTTKLTLAQKVMIKPPEETYQNHSKKNTLSHFQRLQHMRLEVSLCFGLVGGWPKTAEASWLLQRMCSKIRPVSTNKLNSKDKPNSHPAAGFPIAAIMSRPIRRGRCENKIGTGPNAWLANGRNGNTSEN